MKLLREVASEELGEILAVASELDGYQGVGLRFHPLWLVLATAEEMDLDLLPFEFAPFAPFDGLRLRSATRLGRDAQDRLAAAWMQQPGVQQAARRLFTGLSAQPRNLEPRPLGREPLKPMLATISVREGAQRSDSRLPQFTRCEVEVEERPPARLARGPRARHSPLVGGVSCGSALSSAGTLGGILFNDIGEAFGTTCAHVADRGMVSQPSARDASNAQPIGDVVAATILRNAPPGVPCNSRNPGAQFNTMDAALIRLNDPVSVRPEVLEAGEVHGLAPAASIGQEQPCEFTGRSSGLRRLVTAQLNAEHRFQGPDGTSFCFKDTIELRHDSRWGTFAGRAVRPGDSGAWVLRQGPTGTEWTAMIIADDGMRGFAVFAEDVLAWCTSLGMHLSVRPR